MISNAYAQVQSTPAASPPTSPFQSQMFLVIGLFVILYFMMIRPQRKEAQKHKKLLDGLKKGDEVITASGLYGKVTGVAEQVITLEVANNVKVRVSKSSIAGLQTPPAQSQEVVNG